MRKSKRAKRSRPYRKRAGRIGLVRLDMMESAFGPAPSALDALRSIDAEAVSAYPEYENLRRALASRLAVPERSVALGNGSDELIQAVFDAFCDEGDSLLLPRPTFAIFGIAAEKTGVEIVGVDYNDDLSFPKERFLEALEKKPRAAVIVTPNNPTGSSVEKEFLLEVASRFPETLFLIDEAYVEYAGGSVAGEAARMSNLIVLRTFSKAYGLAGLRCGYAIASAETIETLQAVRAPYSVSAAAVRAARAALSDDDWLRRTVKETLAERRRLKGALLVRGIEVVETEANFVLARFGDAAAEVAGALATRGVLVKNVSDVHRLTEGMLRISVGTPEANAALIRALDEILPASALVFDVDGTLVDVGGSYHRAVVECVERFTGERVSSSEIYDLKTASGFNDDVDVARELCKRRGKTLTYEQMETVFNAVFEGEPAGTGAVSNERLLVEKDLLERLSRSFRLALFTGRSGKHLRLIADRFEIENCFDTVFVLEDTPRDRRKPHPYGLLRVMERLGCERGCYVGDIPDDVRCARAAGLTAISVVPPVREREKYRKALREAGAGFVLEDINLLRELLYE